MGRFLDQVTAYQQASIPLVKIGEDYFDTEENPGAIRKYDTVIDRDELGIREKEEEKT